ncbi:MAG: AGE family epimerase/isomerase [Agathobacter sp.]|nr:AGE family epimerase/isomerase [Agathobacter sp.]
MSMKDEIRDHLVSDIIPFWKGLRDDEYGGYYGYLSYDLKLDKKAEKGCILNSRILWFFSNAYTLLKDQSLLEEADHGYAFLKDYCIDSENGGIYWSMNYDGTPLDTTKHTYNQAFCIYALSSYYEASGKEEALELAKQLFHMIEEKCTDDQGYLEAFTRDFKPESNEKLSENGVLAEKTMNTLLHVFEAYTELYRVSKDTEVKERLEWIMDVFADKVYDPARKRQEVFFDKNYNSLIDLHSYGHDIETAWLIDRGVEVLGEEAYSRKMTPITKALTQNIYEVAFDGHSLANECEKGVVDTNRVWWVQAETIVGFLNGYEKDPSKTEYKEAAETVWQFIKEHVIDPREGSEWFWLVRQDGTPVEGKPIVEPWKCPYHNGRMCMEVIRRL